MPYVTFPRCGSLFFENRVIFRLVTFKERIIMLSNPILSNKNSLSLFSVFFFFSCFAFQVFLMGNVLADAKEKESSSSLSSQYHENGIPLLERFSFRNGEEWSTDLNKALKKYDICIGDAKLKYSETLPDGTVLGHMLSRPELTNGVVLKGSNHINFYFGDGILYEVSFTYNPIIKNEYVLASNEAIHFMKYIIGNKGKDLVLDAIRHGECSLSMHGKTYRAVLEDGQHLALNPYSGIAKIEEIKKIRIFATT